ncbi:hypothetical protein GOBAR_AA31955 [Gossypium barbadense]|uniref:Uncharacterized protein n=1 Tax=Gossypium barbadense TaxID=3634 RepID=A0A2P5WCB6_GOSBA|nr:hypothetical protein GOBAR_AA31955 [Gossypium barbadense]
MVQPTLQEMSLKEAHESFSSNSRGPIHEDQRIQIEELDEWRTHKPRTHDKPKLRQDELNTFPNQLKVGDRVLLDAADPHIATMTPNEEIPRYLAFSHSAVVPTSKKRKGTSSSSGPTMEVRHPFLRFLIRPQEELSQILQATPLIKGCCIDWAAPTYLEITMELCSMFHLQTVMTNYDDLSTVQFRLGGLVRQLNVLEFGTALGLYMEEIKEENDLHALNRHIHRSPSWCWDALVPSGATYNPSSSKASALPPSLSMRMIEKHRGTYPPQYRLAQSTEEEAYEDIPDVVPPQHEDPPTQPPPPSCPVHAVASYANISERLTRFEQQCFQ